MDFAQLSQLGIGFATLGILLIVVRFFTASINRKDSDMKDMIASHLRAIEECAQKVERISAQYSDTVNNHMNNQDEVMKQQTATLERLVHTIERLEKKI